MPGRSLPFPAILAACVAGPYFLIGRDGSPKASPSTLGEGEQFGPGESVDEPSSSWQRWWADFKRGSDDPESAIDPKTWSVSKSDVSLPPSPVGDFQTRRITGPRGLPLTQLLSFDTTPDWLYQNWSRVTSDLAVLDLHGLRVAVVTGTAPQDFVGSATYFFDEQQRAVRIDLEGYMGEPEPLAGVVQAQFGMRRYPSLAAGLYLGFHEDRPVAMLHLASAPLVGANNEMARYRIDLEMNRPEPEAMLSGETLRALQQLNRDATIKDSITQALRRYDAATLPDEAKADSVAD